MRQVAGTFHIEQLVLSTTPRYSSSNKQDVSQIASVPLQSGQPTTETSDGGIFCTHYQAKPIYRPENPLG